MCLYTKMVKNPKYMANKKNGGVIPELKDKRQEYVPVSCGKCIECRKQKAREWQQRLGEEIKHDYTGKYITLTFEDKWLNELTTTDVSIGKKEKQSKEKLRREKRGTANSVATLAVRRFMERWRFKYGSSPKHWLITELGHEGTKRLHLHGIIFTEKSQTEIRERWMYGNIQMGYSMNMRCINYIVKYVTKPDEEHPGFQGKILCSKGLGKGFMKTYDWKMNEYKEEGGTREYIKLPTGAKTALSRYYRNHRYSEDQREKLWAEKLDKNEFYIMGEKIKGNLGDREGIEALKYAQRRNKELGYGDNRTKKKQYMAKDGKIFEINLENNSK